MRFPLRLSAALFESKISGLLGGGSASAPIFRFSPCVTHFTSHARFEVKRRRIRLSLLLATIRNPGQILPSRKGRKIYQSKVGPSGQLLLRVIVKEDKRTYHVVTAYKTSKVAKYWKRP